MAEPTRSNSDPPPEARESPYSFLPVIIACVVAIVVILTAAIIFLKAKATKVVPAPIPSHSTLQIIQPGNQPRPTINV
jgi:hypothetical protein